MSIWIPALHAGMTNRGVLLKVAEAPPPLFSKERTKDTKGWEIITFNFLLRAPFDLAQGMLRDLRGEMSVSILVAA